MEHKLLLTGIIFALSYTVTSMEYFNIALLISSEKEVNNEALQNSLEIVNEELRKDGSNVQLNIFKVAVSHGGLFRQEILYGKNLSMASFILEPYSVDPFSCVLGDLLHIPHISITDEKNSACKNALSMRPETDQLYNALFAMIREYNTRVVAVITEETLSESATLFMSQGNLSQRFPLQVVGTVDFDHPQSLTKAILKLKASDIKRVVLMFNSRYVNLVLQEVVRQDLPYDDYKWFVPLMEFPVGTQLLSLQGLAGLRIPINTLKLQELHVKKKSSPWNGWRSFNNFNRGHHVQKNIDPITHDALSVIARASVNYNRERGNYDRSKNPTSKNSFCPAKKRDMSAPRLIEFTRKVKIHGISGLVQFLPSGYRKIKELEAQEIWEEKRRRLGMWSGICKKMIWNAKVTTTEPLVRHNCQVETSNDPLEGFNPRKRDLRIVLVDENPFVFFDPMKRGMEAYSGFCVDLIERLSRELNFTYSLYLVPDGKSGNLENGTWNGMIGELVRKKADIAVGSLTITSQREKQVDFTKPFMDFTMSLIMKKQEAKEVDIFAFLKPFKAEVWWSIIGMIFAVGLVTFIVDFFSPNGYRNMAEKNPDIKGDEFSFINCVWLATGSMMQQGPDYTPKSAAARILAAIFWFFTLIVVSTYTANLAAFFTTSRMAGTIRSLEDLAKQEKIAYGVFRGGQTYQFFKNAEISLYRKMFAQMTAKDSFSPSTKIAVRRVREGGYAYLTEAPLLSYLSQQKPCNTMLLKNLLEAKSYGFGLRQDSEWTNPLSVKILELREKGFLQTLRLKWWDSKSECPKESVKKVTTPSLELRSLGGVFVVLGIGAVLGFILLVVEVRYPGKLRQYLACQKKQNSKEITYEPPRTYPTYRDFKSNIDTVDSGTMKATGYRDSSDSPISTGSDQFDTFSHRKKYLDISSR